MTNFFRKLWEIIYPILYFAWNLLIEFIKIVIRNPWILVAIGALMLLGWLRKKAK